MATLNDLQNELNNIANAINAKTGSTGAMSIESMADNIRSISTGSDVQQTNGFYHYSYSLANTPLYVGESLVPFNNNYINYPSGCSYFDGQMIIDSNGVIAKCTYLWENGTGECTILYIPSSGSSSEPQEYETLLSGEYGTIYRGGSQTFNINTMTAGLTRAEIVAFTFHCQGSRMSGGGSQYSQDFQIPLDTIYRQDFDMGGGECTYGNLLNGNMEIRFTKPSVSYENETTNYATNITIDATTCTDFDYISVSLGFVYKGFKFANGGTY